MNALHTEFKNGKGFLYQGRREHLQKQKKMKRNNGNKNEEQENYKELKKKNYKSSKIFIR